MKKWMFLFGIAMILGGAQALYTNLSNLKPHEIGIEEYLREGTSRKWLTIQGAECNGSVGMA